MKKTGQSRSPQKKIEVKDILNDWNYCNPKRVEDDLPQPYRFINKVLQKDILGNVYAKIFEIQKYQNDPNYEGHLKPLPPQGSFDISMITCASKDNCAQTTHNHVVTGDAYGNIMILDLNKKMRIARKEVGIQKRILKVSVGSRDLSSDDQSAIQNIAVIAHLDPTVYFYRYRLGENKLFLHHTFQIAKSEKCLKYQDIGEFPIDVQISLYSQFLMVKQYNGNILIFRIPDFQLQTNGIISKKLQTESLSINNRRRQTQNSAETFSLKCLKALSSTHINSSYNPFFKLFQAKNLQTIEQKLPQAQLSSLDIQSIQITEIFYQVEFKGLQKDIKYQDIIQKMKNDILLQQKEQEVQQATKEDPKKKPAPPANQKDKNAPKMMEQEIQPQPQEEFEFNITSISLKQEKSSEGIDETEPYPSQQFQQHCYFIVEPISITLGQKQFNQNKQYDVIIGVAVGWTGISKFEMHKFQATNKYNLPEYLQLKIQQQVDKSIQPEKEKSFTQQQPILVSLPKAPQIKFQSSILTQSLLYPLSCLTVSQSSAFVAIGLKQGTIIIYDISLNQDKYYLDKHQGQVNHLVFCDDWRLISGASDGSVHIYDLLEEGKMIMKRTNQFRKGQSFQQEQQLEEKRQGKWAIEALGVSSYGIAVAFDGQQQVRLYDVWHGEKIGKLQAQQIMDDKLRTWTVWPNPALYCFKRIFIRIFIKLFQMKLQQLLIVLIKRLPLRSLRIIRIGGSKLQSKFSNYLTILSTFSQLYQMFIEEYINLFIHNLKKGVEKEKIFHLFSKIDKNNLHDPSFEVPSLQGMEQLSNRLQIPNEGKSQHGSKRSLSKHKKQDATNKSHSNQNMSAPRDFLNKIKEEKNPVSLLNSLHKSQVSDSTPDFNSSFRSQITKNSIKDAPQKQQVIVEAQILYRKAGILTKELLHPEQFLLEKEKIPVPQLVNENYKVVEHCRNRNEDKQFQESSNFKTQNNTVGQGEQFVDKVRKYPFSE